MVSHLHAFPIRDVRFESPLECVQITFIKWYDDTFVDVEVESGDFGKLLEEILENRSGFPEIFKDKSGVIGVAFDHEVWAPVLDGVEKDFCYSGIQEGRQWAALSDPGFKVEARCACVAVFDIAVRVGVKGFQEFQGVWRYAYVFEGGEEEVLGNGGESGGEIQKNAGAILLCEGGNHGGGIQVKQICKNGAAG